MPVDILALGAIFIDIFLAPITVLFCLSLEKSTKFTPRGAAMFAVLFLIIPVVLQLWSMFVPYGSPMTFRKFFLLDSRENPAALFVAIAYGLLAFALYRVVVRRRRES